MKVTFLIGPVRQPILSLGKLSESLGISFDSGHKGEDGGTPKFTKQGWECQVKKVQHSYYVPFFLKAPEAESSVSQVSGIKMLHLTDSHVKFRQRLGVDPEPSSSDCEEEEEEEKEPEEKEPRKKKKKHRTRRQENESRPGSASERPRTRPREESKLDSPVGGAEPAKPATGKTEPLRLVETERHERRKTLHLLDRRKRSQSLQWMRLSNLQITTKPKGLLTTVDCHQKMTVKSLTSGIDVMTHGKGTVRTKTAMRKSKLRTRKARAIAAGGNPVTV